MPTITPKRLLSLLIVAVICVGLAIWSWPSADAPKVPDSLQSKLDELNYKRSGEPRKEWDGISQTWTADNQPTVTLNDGRTGVYSLQSVDFGRAGTWKNFQCKPTAHNERLDYAINFGRTLHQEYIQDDKNPIQWSTLKCEVFSS